MHFTFCIDYRLKLVSSVRQQSYDSCSLDCLRYFSLMYSAGSCDSLWQDLASFCYILLEFFNIFVIYCFRFVGTELANFFSSHAATSFIVFHDFTPLLEWDVIIGDGLKSFRNAIVTIVITLGLLRLLWLRILLSLLSACVSAGSRGSVAPL